MKLGTTRDVATREKMAVSKITHGHCGSNIDGSKPSAEYNSWRAMVGRCYNPHNHKYPTYGAVGVSVCDRWRQSFQAFLSDMGTRAAGTTLDRFPDKSGNYQLGNCRWATALEQAGNRKPRTDFSRRSRLVLRECPGCSNTLSARVFRNHPCSVPRSARYG